MKKKGALMKRQIPIRIFALCMALTLAVCGCRMEQDVSDKTSSSTVSTAKETSLQKKFDRYLEKLFKESIEDDSIQLHYTLKNPERYGIKGKEKLPGMVQDQDMKKETHKEMEELQKFSYKKLCRRQRFAYDALYDYLKYKEQCEKYPYYKTILSPTTGIQAQLPVIFCEYRLNTEEDVITYLHLLEQTAQYFQSVMVYEKEQIKRGLFMSDDDVDAVVSQIHQYIGAKENNILIETFGERLLGIKNLKKERREVFLKENQKIVMEKVLPAYAKLADDLKVLKGNGTNSAGLAGFPKGKSYYKALIQQKTGSSKSVSEIIAMAQKDLLSCLYETAKLSKKDPEAYEEYANLNIKPYTGNNPQQILLKLQKKMKKDYPEGPQAACDIKYVHSSMEKNASPAFYMIPAIDSYEQNTIYINKSQMENFNQLYATLAHEGYPGHLYQNIYYAARREIPIRYILEYPGYSEGWATYVEAWSYKTVEAGKYTETLSKLNILGMKFNLALCSRIDLAVHYEGWNLEKVKTYLRQFGVSEMKAEKLFHMVVREPANYLSYYVGYREFENLKDYYKEKAGKQYNLKTYHKIILDAGPCSFDILKRRIDETLRMEE